MNEMGNSFMVQPLDTRVSSNSTRMFVGNACRSKEAERQLSTPKLNRYLCFWLISEYSLSSN